MTMADNLAEQAASEEAARKRRTRRVVVASVAGNAMEWYDFFIYGTAAALVFGELFFPKGTDPLLGTMGAFAGFAVGFLARPLGGVIFGHIGDRYGRKLALEWTLGLMGVATFLIGLLPTYEQAGLWAPAAMVALRVMQARPRAASGAAACCSSARPSAAGGAATSRRSASWAWPAASCCRPASSCWRSSCRRSSS